MFEVLYRMPSSDFARRRKKEEVLIFCLYLYLSLTLSTDKVSKRDFAQKALEL